MTDTATATAPDAPAAPATPDVPENIGPRTGRVAGTDITVDRSQENILDRCILIAVSMSRFGVRRKVSNKSQGVEIDADKKMIHVSKDILDSPELKKLAQLQAEVRKDVISMALPCSLFRSGVYALPLELVEPLDDKLKSHLSKFWTLFKEFEDKYEERREDALRRLGPLADLRDYPPVERLRALFNISWSYLTFGVPEKLEGINKAIFERQKAEAATKVAEARDSMIMAMRAGMQALVGHMVERLKPGEDGQPKVFRNSLVENMTEFLNTFDAKNGVTNDADLKAIVEKAKALLKGVNPDMLRSDTNVRDYVAKGFDEIKGVLDPMVTTRNRMYQFDDDDADQAA